MSEISEGIILPIPKTQQETDLYNSLRDYFLKITESINFTEPAAIGGTTPAAGTFTTLIGTNIDGIIGANTPAAANFTEVGINVAVPTSTNGGLDIASGGLSLNIGADVNATTRTNATAKVARVSGYHYTNAEQQVAISSSYVDATQSLVRMGGGDSLTNAATALEFYTASDTTTVIGTKRMEIDSAGLFTVTSGNIKFGDTTLTEANVIALLALL